MSDAIRQGPDARVAAISGNDQTYSGMRAGPWSHAGVHRYHVEVLVRWQVVFKISNSPLEN